MARVAVRESVTLAGRAERARAARAFVSEMLGLGHPCGDVAVLLVSELVTNSMRHSGSAVPGGVVTVTVALGRDGVRVEVTDRSGDGAPVLSWSMRTTQRRMRQLMNDLGVTSRFQAGAAAQEKGRL